MQKDLSVIEYSVLVDMLISNTEYHRELCKTNKDTLKITTVLDDAKLIISELKSRKQYQEKTMMKIIQ